MKLLRETVRRILLQEGMITLDQLPEDIFVEIWAKGKVAIIRYMKEHPKSGFLVTPSPETDPIWGLVIIRKSEDQIGLWEVTQAGAADGCGPLLYDVAMEYATENGIGLVSDRRNVSDGKDGAQGVWNYYLKHRDGVDVQAHQMDDLDNTLTDTPKDNIKQDIAKKTTGWFNADGSISYWYQSPLSKRFTKEPTLLSRYEDKRIVYK